MENDIIKYSHHNIMPSKYKVKTSEHYDVIM